MSRAKPAVEPDDSLNEILAPFRQAVLNVYFHERDGPNLSRFLLEHGRLPYITDEIKPWEYNGWLRAYVILLHGNSRFACEDRWGYFMRTFEAEKILDEQIPQIDFTDYHGRGEGLKQIEQAVRLFENKGHGWNSMSDFVKWLAWGLGVSNEKPDEPEDLLEQLYRSFNLEPLLTHPSDYIGAFLEDFRGRSKKWTGFFLTPHSLVEMMVRMTMDENQDHRFETICEPAVGTGRMLLHASNYLLRMFGQDIDPTCIAITKINGALYAPWITWPFPESFFPVDVTHVPPPPAALPTFTAPAEPQSQPERTPIRVDDAQGSLFDLEE